MRGELAAFDPRVHAARPHAGQAATARNILRIAAGIAALLGGARVTIYPDEAACARQAPPAPRVQDVYSLRCTPQVHGPMRMALAMSARWSAQEINSATDNPLIFDDGAGGTPASRWAFPRAVQSRR